MGFHFPARKFFSLFAFLFLSAAVLLSGCGGSSSSSLSGLGTGTGTGTGPGTGSSGVSISGSITSSVEGPPVAGATLDLVQSSNQSSTGKSATSASTGAFSVTGVSAGTYDLIASKTGYSTARYQDVTVASSNLTGLGIPLFPSSGIGTSGVTPIITLATGTPGAGASVSGTETFTINVSESGSGNNAISDIILRVGGNSLNLGNGNASAVQNTNTMTQNVNFSQFPAGTLPITIVAQDVAHNTDTMTYTVTNGGSSGSTTATFNVNPLAQTFGGDLQILQHNRHLLWSKYHLLGNPDQLELPSGRSHSRVINLSRLSGIKPSSTLSGASIAVTVDIDLTGGAAPAGYNILRATSASGPYTQIGSIPAGSVPTGGCMDGNSTCSAEFNDFDPTLSAGTTYYYQAEAYSGSSVGTPSPTSPPGVTILGLFNVSLVSPGGAPSSTAADTPNTSTQPTLSWQASSTVGTEQVYDPFILAQTNNYTSTYLCGGNTLDGDPPLITVSNGMETSGPSSGLTISGNGTVFSFAYSAFSDPSVDNQCTSPLLGGAIYEWNLAESIAQGSESPPGSGTFLAISVGNGEAYEGGESLATGSVNGAFFFTTQP